MKKLAIFASGSGSNAQKILEFFENSSDVSVALILSNRPEAGVLDRAAKFKVPTYVFDRQSLMNAEVLKVLQQHDIEWIILAGFLWLMPSNILDEYPDRVINIHPALLPQYGGAGMYGSRVHEAIWQNGEQETGITIHYVNNNYDEGQIIMQARTRLSSSDTPLTIEKKVHELEHAYLPFVILQTIRLKSQNS